MYAFWMAKIKSVILNEGLEILEDTVFGIYSRCTIEEITLPSTLKEIGQYAIMCCDDLKTVYIKSGCKADFSELLIPIPVQIIDL